MEQTVDIVYILKSLGLTLFFVGLIGFERQAKHKMAGMTTHMLVALGASALAIVQEFLYFDSISLINEYAATNPAMVARVVVERQRIIAQVIAGVGFLGTGAIIKTNGYITGLTTASTLWISAIIGVTFGIGQYLLGVIVSVLALLTLTIVKRVFRHLYEEER